MIPFNYQLSVNFFFKHTFRDLASERRTLSILPKIKLRDRAVSRGERERARAASTSSLRPSWSFLEKKVVRGNRSVVRRVL